MLRVKVCGITRLDDALHAVDAGVDLLGLNFYSGSKRYIAPDAAQSLCVALRERLGADCPLLIGLFVNADAEIVHATLAQVGLDAVQFSGDEPPEFVAQFGEAFRAIRPVDAVQAVDAARRYTAQTAKHLPTLLVDAYHPGAYGGTGLQTPDAIALAAKAETPRLMLAGGLTPENVGARVAAVRPWAVDVASGVESGTPGIKDREKMSAFVRAAREAVQV